MSAYRKKLIEVALPLEAINVASAREKSIRHGHPSTLHLWWARRPLAAARAVLFAQLVDDPSSWPELFPTEDGQNLERQRLFRLIEELVQWENSNNETVLNAARLEIARSHARLSASPKAKTVLAPGAKASVIDDYLATELPPVHDPFAGGGTIPLEAQRLGLRAIASDLNPVAVLINKALVEIPPKFAGTRPINDASRANGRLTAWSGAEGLAADVRHYGAWMREEAKRRIGHQYPEVELPKERGGGKSTVIAWLWARTVPSPNPALAGVHVPLVSSFWLSEKKGRQAWVEPHVDRTRNEWTFDVRYGEPPADVHHGTKVGRGGNFRCLLSGSPITVAYIREQAQAGHMRARLMAIVAEGDRSRVYLPPNDRHVSIAASAKPDWMPEELVNPDVDEDRSRHGGRHRPTSSLPLYGMRRWGDAFTARQLVTLTTLVGLVAEARDRAEESARAAGMPEGEPLAAGGGGAIAYAEAIATYLALAIDKAADRNTTLCSWETKMDRMRNTFGRQAIPMVWDYVETNPFAGAGGDFRGTVESLCEVLDRMRAKVAATAMQADASSPTQTMVREIISTDPPYYDNISYSDVSDFFYVWLRRSLKSIFPALFSTVLTPRVGELVATRYRFDGDVEKARAFFEDGLCKVFSILKEDSVSSTPVVIYYAFRQTESDVDDEQAGSHSTGWESMLSGLIGAGLTVDGTWPMRTELGSRIVSFEKNALASSIVLACRPRVADAPMVTRSDFRRALRGELPAALKALQQGNIAPVDVAQASIGPGMAIFSRYKQVLEADGSSMTVRAALQLINEVLDEYLASGEGDFDADTRFAITWYEQHAWDVGAFGDAENIAKARNISVQGVVEAGICRSGAGKVRLLKREELPAEYDPSADERPTVWDFTQRMIRYLEDQGEEAAARHLKRLGPRADATRELAYRLYNTCERKKWAEDARAYNGLILAWPELEKLAARMSDEPVASAPSTSGTKGKKSKASTKGQQDLFGGNTK